MKAKKTPSQTGKVWIDDTRAMESILSILREREDWDAQTLSDIYDVVRATGRSADPDDK